ncbi:MAG: hypothetical protein OHK0039_11260 [Bacteroidia bacterium]
MSQQLWSQAAKQLSLVGHLGFPAELNDIWGYVDSSGREYALVGRTDGVSIVDLAQPTQPVELHFIPGAFSVWRDLKTYAHYAYVSNETNNGLLIVDLSGLPGSIAFYDTIMGGIKTAHNLWIDEAGRLFMTGTNTLGGGVAIFDLTADPSHPNFLGSYDQRYVHDLYARDDRAYLAEINAGRLTILDLSDSANPDVIGSRTYVNGFTHNAWLNDAGTVCFTTDELNSGNLIAWDVQDPDDIRELDRIRSSLSQGLAIPHNVHVYQDYLVTSYYKDGIHIVDASRPGNLVEVGYYDTSPLEGGGFSGCWGAYPFLPSGLILASDIEEGLFVLQPAYRRGAYLEGLITDAETSAPLSGVDIDLQGAYLDETSRLDGRYALGVADSGSYQLVLSLYGYETDTLTVNLVPGVVVQLDIALQPLTRVDWTVAVLDAVTLLPIEGAQVQATTTPLGEARFAYTSDAGGAVAVPRFVANDYHVIVGKWGYLAQETFLRIDSSQAALTYYLQPGYRDEFALDLGWTVQGDAQRGMWQRGEPIGTYETFFGLGIQNPEYDLPDDIGDACYVTGNEGGGAFGYDVDNGYTLLVSPPIDLRRYDHPRINYYWWLLNWSLRDGGRPANDFLRVSLTDGVDTFEVRRYIGPFDTLWQESSVTVAHYFPNDREIQVLFYTQDFEPGNQDAVEAGVDGFRVLEGYPLAIGDMIPGVQLQVTAADERLRVQTELPPAYPQAVLYIHDLQGRLLHRQALGQGWSEADLPFPHPHGVYTASIVAAGRRLQQVKFRNF